MGKMPDIGWMELFAEDRETDRAPSIRLKDTQVYFEVSDRVGFFDGAGRQLTGVIEKLNLTRNAGQFCGGAAEVLG